MSMKHIGTKILAGVLVVLLAGAGVLIWRNLPEDAPRLQEPEETVRQEPEVQPDTTATLCVAGDIVAHMPLVADAWNGETYDFTHLFAGGITRLRITQRPVWRLRSTVRRIRATRSSAHRMRWPTV